jgi:molybdopterin-biosynthesis enzyme MoeA-like protein
MLNFYITILFKNSATIITIGDEMTIGQIVDTNSAFIAKS